MANYPLKKIQIGSDTYEIQSKKTYRVTLEASLSTRNNIGSLSIKEILETYDSYIQWDITSIVDTGFGGRSYDPQQVMIDDLDGVKFFNATYMFNGGDGLIAGSFINWAPNDSQASKVMFGIDESNLISGLVSVIVDTENNTVGNMILSSFGGGGGGGSVTKTIIGLYDTNLSSIVTINNINLGATIQVMDITDPNNPVALTDTQVINAVKNGICQYQDSKHSSSDVIVSSDSGKNISIIYEHGTVPYFFSASFQWSTNWGVQKNKQLTLQ